MNVTLLSRLDDPNLRIQSIAVLPRPRTKTGAGNVASHFLYVGTSDACITMYAVTIEFAPNPDPSSSSTSAVPASVKSVAAKQCHKRSLSTSKHSVPFLAVDARLKDPRVIALCEGRVIMVNSENLDSCSTFDKAKLEGVSLVCVACATDGPRLAALIKRQVICMNYTETASAPFVSQDGQTLTVSEGVSAIAWVGNALIVATRRDFTIYNVKTHQLLDQIVLEKTALGPGLLPLGDFVACRSGCTFSLWGGREQAFSACPTVTFSEEAVAVSIAQPFHVALSARIDGRILIKSAVDGAELQPVSVPLQAGAWRCSTGCGEVVYAATNREMFGLSPLPVGEVVRTYITHGQLDRAVAHVEAVSDPSSETFHARVRAVHFDCALEAFSTHRDEAAFHHFERSQCNPREVINMFPELLPRAAVDFFSTPGDIGTNGTASGRGGGHKGVAPLSPQAVLAQPERRGVYQMLRGYLTRRRRQFSAGIARGVASAATPTPPSPLPAAAAATAAASATTAATTPAAGAKPAPSGNSGNDDKAANDLVLSAIDLALLILFASRAVDYTAEDLEALFLPRNWLVLEECEPLLLDPAQESLRVLLYATHQRCGDALQLCQTRRDVETAVIPLRFAQSDSSLLLQHLPWMLAADPLTAVRALTGPVAPNVTPALPEVVLSLIAGATGEVLRVYLRHAIGVLRCKHPDAHTLHAVNLVRMVRALRPLSGTGRRHLDVAAGCEGGILGGLREELLTLLATSTMYDSDAVLSELAGAEMAEERAVLHARNRDHAAALATYVHDLDSVATAIAYCASAHAAVVGAASAAAGAGGSASGSVDSPSVPAAALAQLSGTHSAANVLRLGGTLRQATNTVVMLSATAMDGGGAGVSLPSGGGGASGGTSSGGGAGGASGGGGIGNVSRYNDFFTTLLSVLLRPPPGRPSRMPEALALLDAHARVINPLAALQALPHDTPVRQLAPYLRRVFQSLAHRRTVAMVAANCALGERNSAERQLISLRSRSVFISGTRLCCVCSTKIEVGMCDVFPNLKVAHFRCVRDKERDPIRGVLFQLE